MPFILKKKNLGTTRLPSVSSKTSLAFKSNEREETTNHSRINP